MRTTETMNKTERPSKRWAERPRRDSLGKASSGTLQGDPEIERGTGRSGRLIKVALITTGAIAVAGLAYYCYRVFSPPVKVISSPNREPEPSLPSLPVVPSVQPPALPPSNGGNKGWPLKLHSRGERVEVIQRALNVAYKERLAIDGEWGESTEAAMKRHGMPTVIYQPEFDRLVEKMKKYGLQGIQDGDFQAFPSHW